MGDFIKNNPFQMNFESGEDPSKSGDKVFFFTLTQINCSTFSFLKSLSAIIIINPHALSIRMIYERSCDDKMADLCGDNTQIKHNATVSSLCDK